MKKPKLSKVQFWITDELKTEITQFAQGLSLSASDFYKAGALLLKNTLVNPINSSVNLFTKQFKDLENSELQKNIRKKCLGSGSG